MAKREFLQLAHTYNPKKHGIGGLWYSFKLDGMRGFWDGGVSRGIPKSEVPWANTAKDYRFKEQQIATGLWSKYGNVVHAPDWWLDAMPKTPVDGELWNPGMARQDIRSVVSKHHPTDDWHRIKLYAYDLPPLLTVFSDGIINNTHYKKTFTQQEIVDWMLDQEKRGFYFHDTPPTTVKFRSIYNQIRQIGDTEAFSPHTQYELPFQTSLAQKHIEEQLLKLSPYEDGLIVRHPDKIWIPERVHHVLKVKPWDDAEGTVVGYITGRETDKGSKLLGMMGALILDFNGKRLELGTFNEGERTLIALDPDNAANHCDIAKNWAIKNPGTKCPSWIYAMNFPRGSQVTFKYRGLSNDGIPQEARYWRKY